MRRRKFIRLFGSIAVAWPLTARAQQAAMPVIGLLMSGSPKSFQSLVAAFRQGLSESGYVEGQNLAMIASRLRPGPPIGGTGPP
jgi:putative ABC transport system substrate-binding protein